MKILAGPGSEVDFTHLSKSSCETLGNLFQSSTSERSAEAFAHPEGVMDFMNHKGVPLNKVCLLDPKAEKPLSPEDGDGRFEWFLFGVRHFVRCTHSEVAELTTRGFLVCFPCIGCAVDSS